MNRNLFILVLLLALAFAFGGGQVATAAPDELFFSEYIEGSSYNKALEIYNGTGTPVDLAAGGYTLHVYFNGSASPGTSAVLTGTVVDGDVFVFADGRAAQVILDQADQTTTANLFNGDDAVVLMKGDEVVDAIGQIGFDPGSQWGTGDVSTADNTLRRKAAICAGDTNTSDVFDPALEWDGFATDTFDGLGSHTANCDNGGPQEPKINEFSASTTGTDVEYVEIYGQPNTDYSYLTILEIEGDTTGAGVVDEVIAVGTTDSNGFWLENLPANALENGTITLLLVSNFSGALNQDLDTNNDGILDVTPWEAIVDSVAVHDGGADDRTYGAPVLGVSYDGLPFAPGGASRFPDGYDTESASDWVRNDFDLAGIPGYSGSPIVGEAYNTPGAPNAIYIPPPEACGDPFTPIYTIQGDGLASPLENETVSTEGIVVGDFQPNDNDEFNTSLRGFFIQDPAGDDDPTTSDGIFVFAPDADDLDVGDHVRVRGVVDEYFGLTEITSVSSVWECGMGDTISPTPISLPLASVDEYERYEGMLVTFPDALTISEYFNFDRFGEIVLTADRQFQPTAIYEPGSPEAAALATENTLNRITLDDGRTSQNPDPARHPNGEEFTLDNLFRGGDIVTNLTGVLSYDFGIYRIQPTIGADYTPANPRPAAPEDVGGNITVASFNVLNYFLSIDDGVWDCGPSLDMECRGADTPEEFHRQRAKILSALEAINADVFGLIEMENTTGVEPLADIVAGLNATMGEDTYAYVDTGVIGTDAIRVGIIYKTATVSPVGDYAILDSSVDARFLDDYNRPVLAQTFMDNTNGGLFTVAVNHLKSKGSPCDAIGDPDLGDGAGNCNLTRLTAALALVDWLAADPTETGSDNNLIIGDLNSYDKEDPIDAILVGADDMAGSGDDYVDLLYQYMGEYAYSYLFDGQYGYLDYALANLELVEYVTGATVWHINADEPDLIDYDMSFKQDPQDELFAPDPYRSSDHDPVIVGLAVCEEIAPTLEVSVSPDVLWPANHKYVEVNATITVSDNFDHYPVVTLVSVTSNEPDNGDDDGDTVDDIVIVDDDTFMLRAERSGFGTGRIYTITYQATDACGNTTVVSATVTVPLSMAN
jgi:uncharacterized protein